MKRTMMNYLAKLGLVAALISGSVFAQNNDSSTTSAGVDEPVSGTLDAAGQLKQAREYKRRIELLQSAVGRLARKAETDKDVVKLNCINDKLSQIGGTVTLADSLIGTIASKMSDADAADRDAAFARLTTEAYQKAVTLAQEAEECVGEELSFVGRQVVEVTEEDLPDVEDDTSRRPWWFPRPPTTSPDK